jgi:hypothetical protein
MKTSTVIFFLDGVCVLHVGGQAGLHTILAFFDVVFVWLL